MEVDKQVQKATNNIRKMVLEEIERQKDVYTVNLTPAQSHI
jgi:hypothetical protein